MAGIEHKFLNGNIQDTNGYDVTNNALGSIM
jgi:hypothetical protein